MQRPGIRIPSATQQRQNFQSNSMRRQQRIKREVNTRRDLRKWLLRFSPDFWVKPCRQGSSFWCKESTKKRRSHSTQHTKESAGRNPKSDLYGSHWRMVFFLQGRSGGRTKGEHAPRRSRHVFTFIIPHITWPPLDFLLHWNTTELSHSSALLWWWRRRRSRRLRRIYILIPF